VSQSSKTVSSCIVGGKLRCKKHFYKTRSHVDNISCWTFPNKSRLCAILSDDEFVHKSRSCRNEYYRVLMVASRPFGTRPDPSAYFRLPERDGGFSGVSCLHRESVSERPPRAN
jgi:hypothetical protein